MMHENEITIDVSHIKQLLHAQFPQWTNLEIKEITSSGTDNRIFRLGDDMCIRLPRIPGVDESIDREMMWLLHLVESLPTEIPHILAKGMPSAFYPFHWTVCRWIKGENAFDTEIQDMHQLAIDLAAFLRDLHKIDTYNAPLSRRGVSLSTRQNFDPGEDFINIWEECLQAKPWDKPPVWLHGDLLPTNILIKNDRLHGILDFSFMGIGDPACDLIPAWGLLSCDTRTIFREKLDVDDDTWLRGKGWALSIAATILPYYKDTNPVLVAIAQRMLKEIMLDDHALFGIKI